MKCLALFFCLFLYFLSTLNAQNKYPNVQYNEDLQQVYIFIERSPAVKIVSDFFSFNPEMIIARNASIVIYLKSDSIYHPSADINYNPFTQEFWISRNMKGIGRAPFFDSYHKLEIKADVLYWKMNTPRLEFRKTLFSNLDSPALFCSQDYFDPEFVRLNKGQNNKNPMLQLWELFKSNGFQPLSLQQVTRAYKRSYPDILVLLIDYSVQGFIEYDEKREIIYYKNKLSHYLNNDAKRRDYDNLCWESKSHYATLNMDNFDLNIYDCESFMLSNAHIVKAFPANKIVTVKKNRNLQFSGVIVAGLFDFIARDCTFDYDKFQLTTFQIDSMIIYVRDKTKPKDIYGEYPIVQVKNVVEDISGTMYIDDPKNKSGNKVLPNYPIFESREGGKVFFDQPFILNGEYKRERFYFMIDYFVINNLDNFNIAETKIPGRLVSGGIFPDIHEPLKLQADNSLGFIHLTDTSGITMYGEAAQYIHAIDLSNKGLRGKGRINYLSSTLESDSLVFYLQSVRGEVNSFETKPLFNNVEYPVTSVRHAKFVFEPYNDRMSVTSLKTKFDIFNESKFDGTLTVTSENMNGNGTLNFRRAELISKEMIFKHHKVEAEKSTLKIFDGNNEKQYAFTATNYNAIIDLNRRTGEFRNENFSEVSFINIGYKTNVKEFTWTHIDKNLLRFHWDDPSGNIPINETPARELVKINSAGNLLSTIERGRGEISFNLKSLDYNFDEQTLVAQGVRFIPIGDAAIIPHNGVVSISENAEYAQLSNARIVASREKMYHELYNCFVKIGNGNDFKGSGYYDYVDSYNTKQALRFDTVWYFRCTRGKATVKPETEFTLSPYFGFSGIVDLSSINEFLSFSGGLTFLHSCDKKSTAPLRINQQIDPKNILIELNDKSRDVNDRKATVAIASSNETGKIYTRFGGAKEQINDSEYIISLGAITFNSEKQAYQAASLEKLNNQSLSGNIISLYPNNCVAVGEGNIDLGTKLGRIDFNTHGRIINYMRFDSAVMQLTTSIDFFFNTDAMKIMNEYFANAKDVRFVDTRTDENYMQALINILGQEEYNKYERERRSGLQLGKLPAKLDVMFLFSTLNFEWSSENASFESQKTLPIVIAGGKTVYKEIPGKIVVEKKGSRNTLYIYFELGKDFFFYQFENNTLYAFSSDEKFNTAISKTKAKYRNLSTKGGKAAYTYKIGNRGQKTRFTKKYF
ncbi:MAG: hypothetical protein LBI45_09495 [Bacteroidales bacterium]|jgi:hypothetical protein|nr:hypothetical protein [Bacteroidales bacterium]